MVAYTGTRSGGFRAQMTLSRRRLLTAAGAAVLGVPLMPAAAPAAGYATGDMMLGSPEAPIEIIEYASMTCPHCRSFHETVYPSLKEEWIETGKARFVFREFPLDRYALQASQLARCGGEKKYFAFVETLFAKQPVWARADDPTTALKQIAQLGGVSEAQFDACLADKSLVDMILNTRLKGSEEFGVNATPTILINGEKFEESHDYEAMSRHLESLL